MGSTTDEALRCIKLKVISAGIGLSNLLSKDLKTVGTPLRGQC